MKIKIIIVLILILIVTTISAYGIRNTVFSDIDNDGDLDIFLEHTIENQGQGNFLRLNRTDGIGNIPNVTQAYFFSANNLSFDTYLFIQRDGLTDLLYLNNGNRTFTNVTSTTWIGRNLTGTAGDAIGTLFEDLDGDNITDCLVNRVLITSNASGVFGLRNTSDIINRSGLVNMPRMEQLAAVDINTDNRTDIIGVTEAKTIRVYLNLGDTNNDGIPEFYEASYDLQLDSLTQANFIAAGNIFYGLAISTALPFYPFYNLQPSFVEDVFTDLYIVNNMTANNLFIQRYPQLPITYNISNRSTFYLPNFEDFSDTSNVDAATNGTAAIIANFDQDAADSLDILYANTDNNTRIMLRNGSSWIINFSLGLNTGINSVKMIQAVNLSNTSFLDLAYIGSEGIEIITGTATVCGFNSGVDCNVDPGCGAFASPPIDYWLSLYDFTPTDDTISELNSLSSDYEAVWGAAENKQEILQTKGDLECDPGILQGHQVPIPDQPGQPTFGVPQSGGSNTIIPSCIFTGSSCCVGSEGDKYCEKFCEEIKDKVKELIELGHKPDDETLSVFNPPLDLTEFGFPPEEPTLKDERPGLAETTPSPPNTCAPRTTYSAQGDCGCEPFEPELKEEFPIIIEKPCEIPIDITPVYEKIKEEKLPKIIEDLMPTLLTGAPLDLTDDLTEALVDIGFKAPENLEILRPPTELFTPPRIFENIPKDTFIPGLPPTELLIPRQKWGDWIDPDLDFGETPKFRDGGKTFDPGDLRLRPEPSKPLPVDEWGGWTDPDLDFGKPSEPKPKPVTRPTTRLKLPLGTDDGTGFTDPFDPSKPEIDYEEEPEIEPPTKPEPKKEKDKDEDIKKKLEDLEKKAEERTYERIPLTEKEIEAFKKLLAESELDARTKAILSKLLQNGYLKIPSEGIYIEGIGYVSSEEIQKALESFRKALE